jgi:serine/threonine protein kinase
MGPSPPGNLPPTGIAADGPFPREFGRYVLQAPLGRGGMGAVYRAFDTVLRRDVALKMPHPELLQDPGLLARFYNEARAAARLWHPNLCPVFDVGEHQGLHYLTMQYVPGRALDPGSPRSPAAVAALVRKLALAMDAAHRLGVIHRDLKPANILVTDDGEPVITDFGIALCLGAADERLTSPGVIVGTLAYLAPEQLRGDPTAAGPAGDVYSLGVILYLLLTGRLPFHHPDRGRLRQLILEDTLVYPSSLRPGLPPALEAACVRALARAIDDRTPSMRDLAEDLAAAAGTGSPPAPAGPSRGRPLLDPGAVRYFFVGLGEVAPAALPPDRLYLDVGNDLRPGVLDHHPRTAFQGSTSSLVLAHPELLEAAVRPHRRPGDPFTIVLHEKPDLDCIASAYLASHYLTTGAFPAGADLLTRYVDQVDQGAVGMSLANPFSLYAAYHVLGARLERRAWNSNQEQWGERVRRGLELAAHVTAQAVRQNVALPAVDAFRCPGLFDEAARNEVRTDLRRYERKLADPACRARRVLLRLPGQTGGRVEAETLLVRDVQNAGDPERCLFFKDWARTDAVRCPNGRGFVGLSVFMSAGAGEVRRAILSVTPDSGVSLRGLGEALDRAEGERRRAVYGEDDRVRDPATGQARSPRPGYASADPWYDGRAHAYTILDGPRAGTLLTADEIEALFLQFGGAAASQALP